MQVVRWTDDTVEVNEFMGKKSSKSEFPVIPSRSAPHTHICAQHPRGPFPLPGGGRQRSQTCRASAAAGWWPTVDACTWAGTCMH
eukprot:286889-Chlamydomonas_euryale.AAC.1